MDPELRYGRAYVPRANYSYITTTNLSRNRSKPSTRTYSQPAPIDRDWTPSTTNWMPKRDWYYGAYEELYAPSSSLKSRLKSGDTNVSRRRLNDDINYELNRFKPPHLASITSHPVKRHRTWEHDDWQDRMDILYPYTQNLSYRDQLAKDNYSGTRLSRRAAYNTERLNDLNYDYNILKRGTGTYQTDHYSRLYSQGNLNDYPALPRASIYTPISKQKSLYDEVDHYMFPSAYPRGLKPLTNMSYLDTHEDWLKTMSHDLYPPRRYFNFPEPRSQSTFRDNYSSSSYRPRSSGRGKSFSPIRRTPVKSYPAPSYPAYEKTPARNYDSPSSARPRKVTTFDDEPVSDRPRARAAARNVSPPSERPSRPRSKPTDEEEGQKPKSRPRFEPDTEEPSLEKRRIPSVSQETPEEKPKPSSKRPSVVDVKAVTPTPTPTPTPSPRPSIADQEEPVAPATPRRSLNSEPKSKTPTPRASITPAESKTPTPRASIAETPRESAAETPRASVAKTPRESVAETPRESVSSTTLRPKKGGLGWDSPKPSVADEPKEREPSPAPSETEVFEDEVPVEEEAPVEEAPSEREATPEPEPEETPVEEEREPSPAPVEEEEPVEEEAPPETPKTKVARSTSEEFVFEEDTKETPAENGDEEQPEEEFEWGTEEETKATLVQSGQTTTTKVTTTTTTTYEEEEVEEFEETVEEEILNGGENDELEYGEEEDLNAQSLKERGYSRENSTGSQIENGDEEEE